MPVVAHQLGILQESLDFEVPQLPGHGVNGNSAPAGATVETDWILRLRDFLGRDLTVIVHRLGSLQKGLDSEALGGALTVIVHQLGSLHEGLDSEASLLPGQGVNGNIAPARASTEQLDSGAS